MFSMINIINSKIYFGINIIQILLKWGNNKDNILLYEFNSIQTF